MVLIQLTRIHEGITKTELSKKTKASRTTIDEYIKLGFIDYRNKRCYISQTGSTWLENYTVVDIDNEITIKRGETYDYDKTHTLFTITQDNERMVNIVSAGFASDPLQHEEIEKIKNEIEKAVKIDFDRQRLSNLMEKIFNEHKQISELNLTIRFKRKNPKTLIWSPPAAQKKR